MTLVRDGASDGRCQVLRVAGCTPHFDGFGVGLYISGCDSEGTGFLDANVAVRIDADRMITCHTV